MIGIVDSGQKIVTSGLILHLDAGQLRSYSGSGTTWRDISGNGSNGTLTNGPTFDSGNGGSIVFDGSNDYVSIGTNTGVNDLGTGDFTITGWFKRPSAKNSINQSAMNIIGDWYTFAQARNEDWQIMTNYNVSNITLLSVYRGGFGFLFLNTSTSVSTNNWVNFALSRISSTVRLYSNGNDLGAQTDSGYWGSSTGNFNIGVDGDNVQEIFVGNIATILVYKGKGLTGTELLQNYNAQKSRFGL
jgi:hypothetical protein